MSLNGDYLNAEGEQAPFSIGHGYSKDKRLGLKQFVLSLLCVDGTLPIVGELEDGNASDKTINHRLFGEVGGHIQQHGVAEDAFIYIADSAMATAANLAQTGERTRFITHLPDTYSEHERVEALGLTLLISLLIWRLIELVMRTEMQAREATLPGCYNKPTARPTA